MADAVPPAATSAGRPQRERKQKKIFTPEYKPPVKRKKKPKAKPKVTKSNRKPKAEAKTSERKRKPKAEPKMPKKNRAPKPKVPKCQDNEYDQAEEDEDDSFASTDGMTELAKTALNTMVKRHIKTVEGRAEASTLTEGLRKGKEQSKEWIERFGVEGFGTYEKYTWATLTPFSLKSRVRVSFVRACYGSGVVSCSSNTIGLFYQTFLPVVQRQSPTNVSFSASGVVSPPATTGFRWLFCVANNPEAGINELTVNWAALKTLSQLLGCQALGLAELAAFLESCSTGRAPCGRWDDQGDGAGGDVGEEPCVIPNLSEAIFSGEHCAVFRLMQYYSDPDRSSFEHHAHQAKIFSSYPKSWISLNDGMEWGHTHHQVAESCLKDTLTMPTSGHSAESCLFL